MKWVPKALFPGEKQPESETDCSFSLKHKVTEVQTSVSTSPNPIHGVVLKQSTLVRLYTILSGWKVIAIRGC
jgi:hypothetical protein